MKKAFIILAACLLLTACGDSDSSTAEAASAAETTTATAAFPEELAGLSTTEEAVTLSEYMMEGSYEKVRASFNAELYEKLSAEQLEAYWNVLAVDAGDYEGHIDTMSSVESGLTVTECILDYSKRDISLTYVFEEGGRVGGFWLDFAE
ncbi:MAG: DUF3887 domain-containing protein [Ruminococcus sp.]|nr:DUF3887 domain-containing protein [Ruminococcus sp.]